MEDQKKKKSKKDRKAKSVAPYILAVTFFALLLFLALFFYQYAVKEVTIEPVLSKPPVTSPHVPSVTVSPVLKDHPKPSVPEQPVPETETKPSPPIYVSPTPALPEKQTVAPTVLVEYKDTEIVFDCEQAVNSIRNFFIKLDSSEYIAAYNLEQKSEPYFLSLIEKLAQNPPVVTRETDDLFTILQNTAHFFRIIGQKNISLLKSILDQEKAQFETVLLHFYELTKHKECLKKNFHLTIPDEALYEYAGFFLNTMGGRLYLFRRDSVSRLAVSFYSILIIDHANTVNMNHHGLEIKQAVALLIPEIENNNQLVLKDYYLEKLYEIEDRLP